MNLVVQGKQNIFLIKIWGCSMGLYKKNNKWWIDYYVNGRRIRRSISKKKKQAEKIYTKTKADILMKKFAIPINEKIKFVDFSMRYIEEHSKPKKKSYRTDIVLLRNLVEYFGDMLLHEITDHHFELYRNKRINQNVRNRKRKVSPTTVNREGALLRSILNRAVKWGKLSLNPITKMEMYKEEPKERNLTESEINLLVSSANPPLKHIILVALNTGMRRGEILNLEWNRVNIEERFITVNKTKSSKLRKIPLNNPMIDLFSKLQLQRQGKHFVFENPETRKPFTTIKTAWKTLLKRTKITDLRFHDLRHCFATYTLLRGGDLIHLRETLGHARVTTTERYAKAQMEGQRKLVNGFEVAENPGEVINISDQKIG